MLACFFGHLDSARLLLPVGIAGALAIAIVALRQLQTDRPTDAVWVALVGIVAALMLASVAVWPWTPLVALPLAVTRPASFIPQWLSGAAPRRPTRNTYSATLVMGR